jgi:hypothetical protein
VYISNLDVRKEKEVPKVYVVSETTQHNVTPAMQYGEIVTILPPNAQILFSVVPVVSRIKRKLENFSDEDYLVLIGDPSAIGIVCAAAAAKNNGRFKLLKWDRREKLYVPMQIDLFYKGESDDY